MRHAFCFSVCLPFLSLLTNHGKIPSTMSSTLRLAPVKRALISVSDKSGIVEFSQALHQRGVEILSTGGTFKLLTDNGVPAVQVSEYTGFPEMMEGRVKTLHPKVQDRRSVGEGKG